MWSIDSVAAKREVVQADRILCVADRTGSIPRVACRMLSAPFPLMAAALAMGGHIRSGMEDVAYVARGTHAESNAHLIARAARLCEGIGRPVATPRQAREILQLPSA